MGKNPSLAAIETNAGKKQKKGDRIKKKVAFVTRG